jgi:hypothetical protein
MDANAIVVIHGVEWKLADLRARIEECRRRQWRRQRWARHDALVHRGDGMALPYVGQPFDPAEFEVVRGGWTRNFCEVCRWELFESDDPQHSVGYTDGRRWICSECHDRYIRRP